MMAGVMRWIMLPSMTGVSIYFFQAPQVACGLGKGPRRKRGQGQDILG